MSNDGLISEDEAEKAAKQGWYDAGYDNSWMRAYRSWEYSHDTRGILKAQRAHTLKESAKQMHTWLSMGCDNMTHKSYSVCRIFCSLCMSKAIRKLREGRWPWENDED